MNRIDYGPQGESCGEYVGIYGDSDCLDDRLRDCDSEETEEADAEL